MFSKDSLNKLLSELKKKNYTGDDKELFGFIMDAKRQTECEGIHGYFQQNKNHINEDKLENFSYITTLFDKLIKKYKYRVSSDFISPYAHFYGSKHPTTGEKFTITMDFNDSTSQGSNGYYGDFHVRILFGYDDHRKEKYITLVDKKPY
jgi:hypothetical protein